jgi:uncharacterized FlaG/YvyC family protein
MDNNPKHNICICQVCNKQNQKYNKDINNIIENLEREVKEKNKTLNFLKKEKDEILKNIHFEYLN